MFTNNYKKFYEIVILQILWIFCIMVLSVFQLSYGCASNPDSSKKSYFDFLDEEHFKTDSLESFRLRYGEVPMSFADMNQKDKEKVLHNLKTWIKEFNLDYRTIKDKKVILKLSAILSTTKNIGTAFKKLAPQIRFKNKAHKQDMLFYFNYLDSVYGIHDVEKTVSLLEKTKNPFLKERYLFLAVRGYHYENFYQDAVEVYHRYSPQITHHSIVSEWTKVWTLGAFNLLENKKLSQDVIKTMENLNFDPRYFYTELPQIKTEEEWNNIMTQAKNNEEKAMFHYIRGDDAMFHEIKNIYRLAPESDWLKKANYSILRHLQRRTLETAEQEREFSQTELMQYQDQRVNKQIKALSLDPKDYYFDFVNQVIAEYQKTHHELFSKGKIKKSSALFSLLFGKLYIELLEEKIPHSDAVKLLHQLATPLDIRQLKIFDYLVAIKKAGQEPNNWQKSRISLDKHLKKLLIFLEFPDIEKNITELYNENLVVYLIEFTAFELGKVYPKNSIMGMVMQEQIKTNANPVGKILPRVVTVQMIQDYEKYRYLKTTLVEKEMFHDRIFSYIADENELFGKFYMAVQDFDNAIKNFSKFKKRRYSSTSLESTFYDPFGTSMRIRNTNDSNQLKKEIGILDVVKKMRRLEKKLAHPKYANDVLTNYEFANGLYNLSGAGNFGYGASIYRRLDGIPDYLNRAEKHYKIALALAKKPEFQAKIAYQLLKVSGGKTEYNNYKKQHQNTKFGQKMIEECINFRQLQFNY